MHSTHNSRLKYLYCPLGSDLIVAAAPRDCELQPDAPSPECYRPLYLALRAAAFRAHVAAHEGTLWHRLTAFQLLASKQLQRAPQNRRWIFSRSVMQLFAVTVMVALFVVPLRLDYPELFTSDPDSAGAWVAVCSPIWALFSVIAFTQV